jgi:hypothetical protein
LPKRLAITIAGAVSLGSYEAGVLYEIIHAIGQHNEDPATTEADRIVIDVLTGASAGGMTATIAAQKLLFEGAALEGPYTNALYCPWVADVDLEKLLTAYGADDAMRSILSSQLIEDISKRYLTQRYEGEVDLTTSTSRHPAVAPVLRLGLAMSNLNGVDYGLSTRPADQFIYTRYQDELTVTFDATEPKVADTLDSWEPVRNAAVSCGAFPFAFRAVEVVRRASDYAEDGPRSPMLAMQPFAYTDGGTFDNEPLGLAKNLVDEVDMHRDTETRFYLFVSPRALASTGDASFSALGATYVPFAKRLVSAIFDEAAFQDWVMVEELNKRLALFNGRASSLVKVVAGATQEALDALSASTALLLPSLFPHEAPGDETVDEARARLEAQFSVECKTLDARRRKVWIDSILTLEAAAELATRDEMAVYGITARAEELASHELFAFAGFFDRRFREHDYDVGRTKAQGFLATINGEAGGALDPLGPIRFTPEEIRSIDKSLDGITFDRMDRGLRESVRDRLRERADVMLQAAGLTGPLLGAAERKAIDLFLIKPALDRVLKLG